MDNRPKAVASLRKSTAVQSSLFASPAPVSKEPVRKTTVRTQPVQPPKFAAPGNDSLKSANGSVSGGSSSTTKTARQPTSFSARPASQAPPTPVSLLNKIRTQNNRETLFHVPIPFNLTNSSRLSSSQRTTQVFSSSKPKPDTDVHQLTESEPEKEETMMEISCESAAIPLQNPLFEQPDEVEEEDGKVEQMEVDETVAVVNQNQTKVLENPSNQPRQIASNGTIELSETTIRSAVEVDVPMTSPTPNSFDRNDTTGHDNRRSVGNESCETATTPRRKSVPKQGKRRSIHIPSKSPPREPIATDPEAANALQSAQNPPVEKKKIMELLLSESFLLPENDPVRKMGLELKELKDYCDNLTDQSEVWRTINVVYEKDVEKAQVRVASGIVTQNKRFASSSTVSKEGSKVVTIEDLMAQKRESEATNSHGIVARLVDNFDRVNVENGEYVHQQRKSEKIGEAVAQKSKKLSSLLHVQQKYRLTEGERIEKLKKLDEMEAMLKDTMSLLMPSEEQERLRAAAGIVW